MKPPSTRREKTPATAGSDRPRSAANAGPASRLFWLGLLVVGLLLVGIRVYRIDRPYNGLHSWGQASGAWAARAHATYGLGYTRGVTTLAVGDPPDEARRYVSHPQLPGVLNGVWMKVLGCRESTLRIANIVYDLAAVLLFVGLLRRLTSDETALLAGAILAALPISGYFGLGGIFLVVSLWAFWRYLLLIGRLESTAPPHRRRWLIEFGVAVLLLIQIQWSGCFYAFVFGAHYVLVECVLARRKPNWAMLLVLVLAPLVSVAANLAIMAWGFEGDWQKIVALYKWRSAKGERGDFRWSDWFGVLGGYGRDNFTLVGLIALGLFCFYRVLVQVIKRFSAAVGAAPRPLVYAWFWGLPGVMYLLAFRGLVWEHQYWQKCFSPFVALGMASAILLLGDLVRRLTRGRGRIVATGIVVLIPTALFGLQAYRGIRSYHHDHKWQSLRTLELFQKLNRQMAPHESLLSYKDFLLKQHPAKAAFYRPEYAWYLDRHIDTVQKLPEILERAASGTHPYYFIPDKRQPPPMPPQTVRQLARLSHEELIQRISAADKAGRRNDVRVFAMELQDRRRRWTIEQLKRYFPYEHFEEDPQDVCHRSNVPCYIFDLRHPKLPLPTPDEKTDADPVE